MRINYDALLKLKLFFFFVARNLFLLSEYYRLILSAAPSLYVIKIELPKLPT